MSHESNDNTCLNNSTATMAKLCGNIIPAQQSDMKREALPTRINQQWENIKPC